MRASVKLMAASLTLGWWLMLTPLAALTLTIPPNLSHKVSFSINRAHDFSPIYAYNANSPMLIASNMKLVTSYIALQTLGPNFRWQTSLSYDGVIHDGILDGNLYVIGGGDPSLTSADLTTMLQQLKQHGIKQINGNLIIDSHIFNESAASSELYPEPLAEYSVAPAGLIIDSNLSLLTLTLKNKQINWQTQRFGPYQINNKVKLLPTKQSCGSLDHWLTISLISNRQLQISGNIPASCQQASLAINLLEPNQYNQIVLAQLLHNVQIKLSGTIQTGRATNPARRLTSYQSPPLRQLLITMNKNSNNLYAKTIFLSLGAYASNNWHTATNARNLYLHTLNKEFNFPELRNGLENGAGLSRHERLTSQHMAFLLYHIYHSPYFTTLLATLPTPGESGTLENEFLPYRQRLFVKTGSLSDVKAYSGFFQSASGTWYLIAAMANHINESNPSPNQLTQFQQLVSSLLSQLP